MTLKSTGRGLGKIRWSAALSKGCCALLVFLLVASPAPFAVATPARNAAPHPSVFTSNPPPSAAWRTLEYFSEFATPAGQAPTALTALGPPRIRTDKKVYPKPPLPVLPAAGGKFIDAVFGAELMRATDSSDYPSPGCGTYYSHWPTFNRNNTLLLIRCGVGGDAMIKRFDPDRFELGAVVRRRLPALPDGSSVEWQGATWSAQDPDLLYAHVNGYSAEYARYTGMKLYAYRVSTDSFTLVKDFAPQLAPGRPDHLFEMHADAATDVYTFMHKRVGQYEPLGFIAWRRSTDEVLKYVPNDFDANACSPDKSGRYLYFPLNKTQADGSKARILDLQTGRWETLYWTAADDPPGHGDAGTGVVAGRSPYTGGISHRRLETPHARTYLFDMKDERGVTDWSNDQHTTFYADDEGWVLLGTYDDPGETGAETHAFEDELIQVSTDGSQRIRRLAHTRSRVGNRGEADGYWAIPKPTITRDGRYVAFTSNWEDSGRYDLFIARIEPAPRLKPQTPAPAQPTRPRRSRGQTAPATPRPAP